MAVDNERTYRNELLIASLLFAAGLTLSTVAVVKLTAEQPREVAQATQPLQPSPPEDQKNKPPADSKPGGDRPTTPAPEPARPDAEAQKTGAEPALPPAPAEKTAPPIQQK